MKLALISDRARISPQTGNLIQRDLPVGDAARDLEARFVADHEVRAPRGGVASFQAVVSTDEPTDGAEIALRVTPFTADGHSLEGATVCYEYPCQLDDEEWTFDGLVPAEVYREAPALARRGPLGPRRFHVFWIDLPVPREAAPGAYRGRVEVEGAEPCEITITVLPLALPLTPRITVDLNSYANRILEQHPDLPGDQIAACEHSYYRAAHDHRAVLHYLGYGHSGIVADGYAPPLTGRGRHLRVADWEAYDRRFGPLLDGSAMASSPGGERPLPHFYLPFNYDWPADFANFRTRGYELEWANLLADFRRHFQDKGWTETKFEVFFNPKKRYRFYPWDGDETKDSADREHFLYFGSLIDRATRLAGPAGAKTRIIYRTDISWSFIQDALHDQIGPLFDLWVVNMGNFTWSRSAVEALTARGQLAWTYSTADDSANPGRPMMDLDRQVITSWRRGADGLLPNWLATGTDAELDRASALAMLYPGHRFGFPQALTSLRLSRLRRATETADLLEMLAHRGRALVDELADVNDDDWWGATPAWTLQPTETMRGEMYGWQPTPDPLSERDPYLPALLRDRAIELLLERIS